MAGGKGLRNVVQNDRHPVQPAGHDRFGLLVSVPVGEVEQAIGDQRGRTVRRYVFQPCGDHRRRPIGRQAERQDRCAEYLYALRQWCRVEIDRASIVGSLVSGQFAGKAIGTPLAKGDTGRKTGGHDLRRAQGCHPTGAAPSAPRLSGPCGFRGIQRPGRSGYVVAGLTLSCIHARNIGSCIMPVSIPFSQ